ncbi:MAG TPA: hypothetical protein PLW93_06405 [Candidatus Absconditabacterales bacterium]|nr:hypothetical protein [Candidatus Absconditabacterales bacterium]HNG97881.1 hypothetical protein [Candidatus Absconditabacterales bacterium]
MKDNLITSATIDTTHTFYEIMNYPLPVPSVLEFFKRSSGDGQKQINDSFHYEPSQCELESWGGEVNQHMSNYLGQIAKHSWIRRSLPFVSHVYLANSITFNALHQGSDIDLVILCTPGKIRLVRLLSWFILGLLGLSRIGSRSVQKYCLSFYITRNNLNLYSLLIQPIDIYFIFWLAHLVPLYSTYAKEVDLIWKENKWIKGYLPHHPLKQVIRLGNPLIIGDTIIKRLGERILGGFLGNGLNTIIGIIWKPILYYKTKKLGKKGRGVIVDDTMLKFHMDKRKEITLKYLNKSKKKHVTEAGEKLSIHEKYI